MQKVENIAWLGRRILCIDTFQGGKSLAERRQAAGGFSALKVEKVQVFQLWFLAKNGGSKHGNALEGV